MGKDRFTTSATVKAFDEASPTFDKVGKAAMAAGAVVAAGLAVAVNAAADLEYGMAKVGTITGQTVDQMGEMTDELQALSIKYGEASGELTEALFNITSAGVSTADAMGVLEVAAMGAQGGFSSVGVAADGVTSALNAWSIEAEDSIKVMDIFVAAQSAGKMTVEDMAKGMGMVAPQAAAMGVSLEEVSASIAAITLAGTPAKIAFTQYRQALVVAALSATEMGARTAKAGVELDLVAYEAAGATDRLTMLAEAAEGDIGKLTTLAGSTEAVSAILNTTGENADRFSESLEGIQNAAESTERESAKMGDTLTEKMASAKAAVTVLAQEVGAELLPAITDLAETGAEWLDVAAKWQDRNPGVVEGAVKLGLAIATIATAFRAVKSAVAVYRTAMATVASIQAAHIALTQGETLANIQQWMAKAGPKGAIAAGVALGVAVGVPAALHSGQKQMDREQREHVTAAFEEAGFGELSSAKATQAINETTAEGFGAPSVLSRLADREGGDAAQKRHIEALSGVTASIILDEADSLNQEQRARYEGVVSASAEATGIDFGLQVADPIVEAVSSVETAVAGLPEAIGSEVAQQVSADEAVNEFGLTESQAVFEGQVRNRFGRGATWEEHSRAGTLTAGQSEVYQRHQLLGRIQIELDETLRVRREEQAAYGQSVGFDY